MPDFDLNLQSVLKFLIPIKGLFSQSLAASWCENQCYTEWGAGARM